MSDDPETSIVLEYYQLVFMDLFAKYDLVLRRALLEEPKEFRRAHFANRITQGRLLIGQDGWQAFYQYLTAIESRLSEIISRRSVLYWVHLYRRTGVALHPEHDNKTDPITVGLVRQIVELAISKHGSLDRCDDVSPADPGMLDEVLGGHLKRVVDELRAASLESVASHLESSVKVPQWVIKSFTVDDLVDIARIEGLAYEYWQVTATLRALGKGVEFAILDGDWEAHATDEQAMLIASYDRRVSEFSSRATLLGAWFGGRSNTASGQADVIVPHYNIERESAVETFEHFGVKVSDGFVPNFILATFDIVTFKNAHKFIDGAFSRTHGFTLDALLVVLWALGNRALFPMHT